MDRVVIVFFDAGGGHRAAAASLAEAIRRQQRPWTVETINLDDILESIDPLYRTLRIRGAKLYNWTLENDWGWTVSSAPAIPIMHGVIRLLHSRQVALLRRAWKRLRPRLVVSVVPHYNRALLESLHAEFPAAEMVTILTDIADFPPHFWVEPQDQHFICGSDFAVRQAQALTGAPDHVWRVSGMMIHPRFYDPISEDRSAHLHQLGLDPGLPTGLVSYGGYGSAQMLDVAEAFQKSNCPLQLIFLCGRNRKLAVKLRSRFPSPRFHVHGFAGNVARFMAVCDFFIGKPGPASVSEALAMRLPVIVVGGRRTMAQERYNVQWIRRRGVGIAVGNVKEMPDAAMRILAPEARTSALRQIDTLKNRATFEVLDILQRIIDTGRPPLWRDRRFSNGHAS